MNGDYMEMADQLFPPKTSQRNKATAREIWVQYEELEEVAREIFESPRKILTWNAECCQLWPVISKASNLKKE